MSRDSARLFCSEEERRRGPVRDRRHKEKWRLLSKMEQGEKDTRGTFRNRRALREIGAQSEINGHKLKYGTLSEIEGHSEKCRAWREVGGAQSERE